MDSRLLPASQNTLEKLCSAVIAAHLAKEKTRREYVSTSSELDKWVKRYDLALMAGKSDLVKAASFQVDHYREITSKLKSLIMEQDAQIQRLKEQKTHWGQAGNRLTDFDNMTTNICIDIIDILYGKNICDSDQVETEIELKNILIQKKLITELELKLLSRQIEYNQVLKIAKIWKSRAKEVENWDNKEIAQKTNEQFQVFREKAISLKTHIREQEKLISEACALLHQYECHVKDTTSMISISDSLKGEPFQIESDSDCDEELSISKDEILGKKPCSLTPPPSEQITELVSQSSIDIELINLNKKLDKL